jgi:hypothetical protein
MKLSLRTAFFVPKYWTSSSNMLGYVLAVSNVHGLLDDGREPMMGVSPGPLLRCVDCLGRADFQYIALML